jgi:hypothetical protein
MCGSHTCGTVFPFSKKYFCGWRTRNAFVLSVRLEGELMLERDVERYLVSRVKALGGLCLKWVSPGTAGVPDRIVFMPGGRISFVEVKRPGEAPTRLQRHVLAQLEQLGCQTAWVDSKESVQELLA